jgi:hypothetical protein
MTFPPVLATGLFDDVFRGDRDVLPLFELFGLDELVRRELERPVADEPFLLVVLFVLEPVLDLLLLEDFVVCAIVYSPLFCSPLGFRASCAFRAGGGRWTTRWVEF